jgi:hypothetical protein
LAPEHKDLLVSKDLRENKDLLEHRGLLENKVLWANKDLLENEVRLDRPDLLGLLVVGRVKVLRKDTLLAFYRSMVQEDTFVFTPVSNRKESDARNG